MTNQDKNEVQQMLKQLKDELLKEIAIRIENRCQENIKTDESVADTESALCEFDETTDSRMADIENALCELDEGE